MEGPGSLAVNRGQPIPGGRGQEIMEAQGNQVPATDSRRWVARLCTLAAVRDDETDALLWACLFVFNLLAGNYLVRPVRDEMGIAGGTAHLPALFTGTLVGILVVWPLLSTRLSRGPGRPSFAPVFRALQLSLLAFFAAFHLMPASGQAWAARAFFVWASIANLLVVSIAWGSLAGHFTSDQAHRLFGFIAAGGTLGAIVGSSLAGLLAVPAGPTVLMLLAAGFLEFGLMAARRLLKFSRGPDPEPNRPAATETTRPDLRPSPELYLTGLGLWTLLFTTSSAFVYLEQARIVNASISDPAAQTAFFARIDLLVNVMGLVLQVGLTGRALALLGAGGSAATLPLVTLAGCIVLALRPTIATVEWFQVVRRAVDYAIARPSREVFYTVVARSELSRTKCLIDTAVYRAGDAAGAWAYGLVAALPGMSWAAPLAVVPLSLCWIALSFGLGHALRRRLAHADIGASTCRPIRQVPSTSLSSAAEAPESHISLTAN